jgi:hypothetical protein
MALTLIMNNCGQYKLGFDGTDMGATLYTGVVVGPAPEGMDGTEGAALLRPDGKLGFFGIITSYGPQGEATEVARSGLCPAAISKDAAGGEIGQKLTAGEDGFFKEASGSDFDVIAMSAYEAGQQVTVDLGK